MSRAQYNSGASFTLETKLKLQTKNIYKLKLYCITVMASKQPSNLNNAQTKRENYAKTGKQKTISSSKDKPSNQSTSKKEVKNTKQKTSDHSKEKSGSQSKLVRQNAVDKK